MPSLQRLTIKENADYVIDTPLKYLKFEDFNLHRFYLIENAPKLVEAHIIDVYGIESIDYENSLASLTSVKRLSLKLLHLKLVSFDLLIVDTMWWNSLSLMLENSPKLQILEFNSSYYSYCKRDCPVGWEWKQPECLSFHLETFVWTRYEWQREDEKGVATYILKNARRLKKETFKQRKRSKIWEKRDEMLNELASVVRATNSCRFLFVLELK